MKPKISILLLSLLLVTAINSYAKVKYGYVRNTSIYGEHMGALERVLAPGAEIITGKINIQAMDYGFQGYMYDIIAFLLERLDTEIIAKTLDKDGALERRNRFGEWYSKDSHRRDRQKSKKSY